MRGGKVARRGTGVLEHPALASRPVQRARKYVYKNKSGERERERDEMRVYSCSPRQGRPLGRRPIHPIHLLTSRDWPALSECRPTCAPLSLHLVCRRRHGPRPSCPRRILLLPAGVRVRFLRTPVGRRRRGKSGRKYKRLNIQLLEPAAQRKMLHPSMAMCYGPKLAMRDDENL